MRLRNMIILTGFVLLLNGCSAGQMIKYNYQGGQYLKTQNYAQGESTFFDAVAQNPSDPTANYYLGRFLLANNKPKEALPYLQKAVKLYPRDTNYLLWQGIAHGESGNSKNERQSYEQVLKIDKLYAPFEIIGVESNHQSGYPTPSSAESAIQVQFQSFHQHPPGCRSLS